MKWHKKRGMLIEATLLLLGLGFMGNPQIYAEPAAMDSLLAYGRTLFYAAVENEETIDDAETVFSQLANRSPELKGRALTYLGALTALRGKYASWPQKKFDYVQQGLQEMEQGIAHNSEDIESLFIYGSTCYHLPFFFGRSNEAQEVFDKIITLLPAQHQNYDPVIIRNVIAFLHQHAELDSDSLSVLRKTEKDLSTG